MIFTGGHIHDDLIGFCVTDHGTPGDLNDQRLTAPAGHIPPLTVLTGLGGILAFVAEIQQCGHIVVDSQDHTATVTAVTAIRAAGCHVFFPVEGNSAVAASATADCDPYFIYKHENTSLKRLSMVSACVDAGKFVLKLRMV